MWAAEGVTGVELVGELADREEEAREAEDVVKRFREEWVVSTSSVVLGEYEGEEVEVGGRGDVSEVGELDEKVPELLEDPSRGLVPKLLARRIRFLDFFAF